MSKTNKVLAGAALVVAILAGAGYLVRQKLMPPAVAVTADPASVAIAERFMAALEAGDFDAAHALFAERAAEALPPERLREVWEALPAQLGARRSRGPARGQEVAGRPVVTYALAFANMTLDARIGVDETGRIDGFRLVPAATAGPTKTVQTDRFREIETTVAGDLPGLLTVPRGEGPFPAVLLVHGSGPNDRDETIGPNKPFRDLAHGLAERGIASLRYDKRTRVQPEAFTEHDTVEQEVIADALAGLAQLRDHPQVTTGRVFLLGHSLGAMLAPRIAARAEGLAGAALLAAPARPLHEVIPQQIRYLARLDGEIDAEEAARLALIEDQAAAIGGHRQGDPDTAGLFGMSHHYLIDLRDYDPIATAAALPLPLLILQGGRDYQVTEAEDFRRWNDAFSGHPRVRLEFYPDLNHLFMPGTGMATPQEYMSEPKRVDVRVLDDFAAWIHDTGHD